MPLELVDSLAELRVRILNTEEAGRVRLRTEEVDGLVKQHSLVAKEVELTLRRAGEVDDWYLQYVDRITPLTDSERAPAVSEEDPLRFSESPWFKEKFLQAPMPPRPFRWLDVERFERAVDSIEKMWSATLPDARAMLFTGLLGLQTAFEEAKLADAPALKEIEHFQDRLDSERVFHQAQLQEKEEQVQALRAQVKVHEVDTYRLNLHNEVLKGMNAYLKGKRLEELMPDHLKTAVEIEELRVQTNAHKQKADALREQLDQTKKTLETAEARAIKAERQAKDLFETNVLLDNRLAAEKERCKNAQEHLVLDRKVSAAKNRALMNELALVKMEAKVELDLDTAQWNQWTPVIRENARNIRAIERQVGQTIGRLQQENIENKRASKEAQQEKLDQEVRFEQIVKTVEMAQIKHRTQVSELDISVKNFGNIIALLQTTLESLRTEMEAESTGVLLTKFKEMSDLVADYERTIAMREDLREANLELIEANSKLVVQNAEQAISIVSLQQTLNEVRATVGDRTALEGQLTLLQDAVNPFVDAMDDLIPAERMELSTAPITSEEAKKLTKKMNEIKEKTEAFMKALRNATAEFQPFVSMELLLKSPTLEVMDGLRLVTARLRDTHADVKQIADYVFAEVPDKEEKMQKTVERLKEELGKIAGVVSVVSVQETGEMEEEDETLLTRVTKLRDIKPGAPAPTDQLVDQAVRKLEDAVDAPPVTGGQIIPRIGDVIKRVEAFRERFNTFQAHVRKFEAFFVDAYKNNRLLLRKYHFEWGKDKEEIPSALDIQVALGTSLEEMETFLDNIYVLYETNLFRKVVAHVAKMEREPKTVWHTELIPSMKMLFERQLCLVTMVEDYFSTTVTVEGPVVLRSSQLPWVYRSVEMGVILTTVLGTIIGPHQLLVITESNARTVKRLAEIAALDRQREMDKRNERDRIREEEGEETYEQEMQECPPSQTALLLRDFTQLCAKK